MLKLTHVRLLVSDMAAMTAFYRDVMGFEVRVDAGIYVELIAGDAFVGLYDRSLMAERVQLRGQPASDVVVLTFEADDVDATTERLRSAGAEVVTDPHDEEAWVLRVAHVRDPEGNLLEINAPLPG